MRETFRSNRRSRKGGLTLIEMSISLAVGAILIVGAYVTSIMPMSEVTQETLKDEALTSDVNAAFNDLGIRVRPSLGLGNAANRFFAIYNSTSGGSLVTDGTAGVRLSLPYSASSAQDASIYAINGALVVVKGGVTTTVLASGVTSLTFTAVMAGSPLARTGAVLCSLTTVNQGTTYTFSTSILPRGL